MILCNWAEICHLHGNKGAVFDVCGDIQRTFGELNESAAELAVRIREEIHPGAVVALQGGNSALWIEVLLAIWMAEGIVLLEDQKLAASACEAAEQSTGCVLRISIDAALGSVDFYPTGCSPVEDTGILATADLIKLTSGTTGAPRAVLFSGEQLIADCKSICSTMEISPEDRNFGVIAFSHSYGFSNLVTPLICFGVPLVVSSDALPRSVINGVALSRATVLPAVPAIFESMASLSGEMPHLRLCISAGAPLRAVVARRFHERFGVKIHSFYGASECGGICYDRTVDPVDEDGFVGTPMDGVSLEIRQHGEGRNLMRVTSSAVGLRCLSAADASIDALRGFSPADWLAGDSCSGYRIVGRDSDWINVAGHKLDPTEIESVVRKMPQVQDVVVLGVEDSRRGQKICALVVAENLSLEALQGYCEKHLTRWQIPREVRVVRSLPVNERGKLSRRQLARDWS